MAELFLVRLNNTGSNLMDLRLIIFIFFIGFKVIQALTKKNVEQQAGQQNRQVQVGKADRKRRVQSEIESFLSEVAGGNAAQAKPQNAQAAARKERDHQKQLAIAKRRQAEERKRRRELAAARKESSDAARRPMLPAGTHGVDEYVDATIVQSVDDHLGSRTSEMPPPTHATSRAKSQAAAAVVAMLRDPKGVRNAIVVNEILSRPRSLR